MLSHRRRRLAPVGIRRSIDPRPSASGLRRSHRRGPVDHATRGIRRSHCGRSVGSPCSRWVISSSLSIGRSSRTSSIGSRRVVSVPEPTVSRPGLAPRHLPRRWGDFPHVKHAEAGLSLPLHRRGLLCLSLSRYPARTLSTVKNKKRSACCSSRRRRFSTFRGTGRSPTGKRRRGTPRTPGSSLRRTSR